MLRVLKEHVRANLELHKMNIKVYLENLTGIGEQTDVMETIQGELDKITTDADRLALVKSHFSNIKNLRVNSLGFFLD